MLNTYGDLLNILYNNTIYTDKDIWKKSSNPLAILKISYKIES